MIIILIVYIDEFCNVYEHVLDFREYLATFKKTVAMHEVFLQRLASHPMLRNDVNFKVFLEYDQEVEWAYLYLNIFTDEFADVVL